MEASGSHREVSHLARSKAGGHPQTGTVKGLPADGIKRADGSSLARVDRIWRAGDAGPCGYDFPKKVSDHEWLS